MYINHITPSWIYPECVYLNIQMSLKYIGVIQYKGYLKDVTGIWYGVELLGTDKNGDCDGVFNGERYFKCPDKAAVFVMYEGFECRMNSKEIDKLLGTKSKRKKRSNTMAMAHSLSDALSKQMIPSGSASNGNVKRFYMHT